jgi:PDZ domain-containing secreted protein
MRATSAHWFCLLAILASVSLYQSKVVSKESQTRKVAKPLLEVYRVDEKCIFREPFSLQIGDEILAVNGKSFQNPVAILEEAYKVKKFGGQVVLNCRRGGRKFTVVRTQGQLNAMSQ